MGQALNTLDVLFHPWLLLFPIRRRRLRQQIETILEILIVQTLRILGKGEQKISLIVERGMKIVGPSLRENNTFGPV